MKRVFFLNFACQESKITRSRLVLRLPSNSSCFYVTMASRFEIVDEGYTEDVRDKSENENMKKRTEYWRNFLEKVGE